MLKNNIEIDVKVKCVEEQTTQAELAEKAGTSASYVNRLIKSSEKIINNTFVKMMVKLGYDIELTHVKRQSRENYRLHYRNIAKVLTIQCSFRDRDKFASFKTPELKDYAKFKGTLIDFRSFYGLDQYNLKEIDKYMWQLGKEYFPKNYGKKKVQESKGN